MPRPADDIAGNLAKLGFDAKNLPFEARCLAEELGRDETIVELLHGSTWLHDWNQNYHQWLVLTPLRVLSLTVRDGRFFSGPSLRDFSFISNEEVSEVDEVFGTTVDTARGPIRIAEGAYTLRVKSALKSIVVYVLKSHAEVLNYGRVVRRLKARSRHAAQGTASSQTELSMELERLAALKEKGVLSEEEFTAAKTKLLEG